MTQQQVSLSRRVGSVISNIDPRLKNKIVAEVDNSDSFKNLPEWVVTLIEAAEKKRYGKVNPFDYK